MVTYWNFRKITARHFLCLFLVLGLSKESFSTETDTEISFPFLPSKLDSSVESISETKMPPSAPCEETLHEKKQKENKEPNAELDPVRSNKRKLVWPDEVKPLAEETMDILQRGLFRPIVTPLARIEEPKTPTRKKPRTDEGNEVVDLTLITPEKIKDFKNSGGSTPELREKFVSLRRERPPIRNIILFPPSTLEIFSPVARQVLPRNIIGKARNAGAVVSLPMIAHLEPIIEETEEERAERKAQQEKDFLEAEQRRGKVPENLKAEMRKEFEIWQDHLNYIQMRKIQLSGEEEAVMDEVDADGEDDTDIDMEEIIEKKEEKARKIRKGEIEDSFLKFVAPHLEHLEVNGYDLYFTKETLDFERTDSKGVTNHDNMQRGECPIGSDYKRMNFHHLTHYDFATHKSRSIIVLITHTLHTMYSGRLHFGRTTYRDLPRKIVDRLLFSPERRTFNEAIANNSYSVRKELFS